MKKTLSRLAGASLLACLGGAAGARETPQALTLELAAQGADALLRAKNFKALDALAAQYRKPGALSSDGRPLLSGLYDGLTTAGLPSHPWDQRRKLLQQWAATARDASTPGIALAMLDQSQAWAARGGGFAYTVSKEGWRLFHQGVARSRERLERLGARAKVDPGWYLAMLRVGIAEGWENQRFDALFAEATAAFPTYLFYYFAKGIYYSEKWHGSRDQFDAFVEETVATTEPVMGQAMYARLHWTQGSDRMFADGQTDWKRMKAGFDDMLKDFPDDWNRNNFAHFACLAHDWKTTREQIDLIGPHVIGTAWWGEHFYRDCRDLAQRDLASPAPLKPAGHLRAAGLELSVPPA